MKHTKRRILTTAVSTILGTISMGAQANLNSSAVLTFDSGVVSCIVNVGTPPDNCTYGTQINTTGAGSYFGMDYDGSGTITKLERTAIAMHDGVRIGTVQPAAGSHSGNPFGAASNYSSTNYIQVGWADPYYSTPIYLAGDGTDPNNTTTDTSLAFVATTTEVPGITEPWNFFGNTGMHLTSSPITVIDNDVNNDGGLTKTLDFSGWSITWNGIPTIPLGSGSSAWGTGFGDGIAQITCSDASCSLSSTYTLDYYAKVPLNDPSGFGGVGYQVHLEGVVSAVPVPAAVWLFGSGLIGLIGTAKRKKA
ncbi:MAG: VPLPA-CTERM sorting domain-containing protein [Gammaproteobacteria bacterium]|nr:VPLPA-CTERM sorting domain-containing protein [Gammaproteobacteria bacterium]MCK5092699.1 VPLPA-CTERM sorting domain-containing protein [Gammaproteobacteria bacterium]